MPLPAGLPSEVLLRRPDVLQAEHLLRAANAEHRRRARGVFPVDQPDRQRRPRQRRTVRPVRRRHASRGASCRRSTCRSSRAGACAANLGVATADRDIALAQYERSIQAGFREVCRCARADPDAGRATRSARSTLVDAATRAEELSLARYEAGRDSYLVRLDAQRTLYVAQQALIATRLAEQSNRVIAVQGAGRAAGRSTDT